MTGQPAQIVHRLSASGARHVYVDGGLTIQEFLRAGQIHDLTITRVPVLIGDGIPRSDACHRIFSSATSELASTRAAW